MATSPLVLLETSRLALHYFQEADRPGLAALFADAEVMKYVFNGPMAKDAVAPFIARYFARQPACVGLAVLHRKEDGALVGIAGLNHLQVGGTEAVELGFALHKAAQGHGYAPEIAHGMIELCRALGYTKVYATAHPDNHPSAKVLEGKLGFSRSTERPPDGRGMRYLYVRHIPGSAAYAGR